MADVKTKPPQQIDPQVWSVVGKQVGILRDSMNLLFEKNEFDDWFMKFKRFQKIWFQLITKRVSLVSLIPLMKKLWMDCYVVIMTWFQDWRNSLNVKKDTVEFRILKSKLVKCFKIAHRFYYQILEHLLVEYDSNGLLPQGVLDSLNLKRNGKVCKTVRLESKIAMKYIILLQQCLVYLGKLQHLTTIVECRNVSRLTSSSFAKAERYFNLAKIILPSMGGTFHKLAQLRLDQQEYTAYLYQLVRASMARVPHTRSKLELLKFSKWESLPTEIRSSSLKNGSDIENSMANCTICLVSLHLSALSSSESMQLHETVLPKLEKRLWKSLQTEIPNWDEMFQLIVILIGTFYLMSNSKSVCVEKEQIVKHYLNFILEYIAYVLKSSSLLLPQNSCKDRILSITRLITCWIKSNKLVLQSAHRHKRLCQSLCHYINNLLKSRKKVAIDSMKRPEREYFFQEDVKIRDFTCIKSMLTDFNDDKIFQMPDIVDRVSGFVSKKHKLTIEEENVMRINAVLTSISRFLKQNKCLINWDPEISLYVDDNTVESIQTFSVSTNSSSLKILSTMSISQSADSTKKRMAPNTTETMATKRRALQIFQEENSYKYKTMNVVVSDSSHSSTANNSKIIYSETTTKNISDNILMDKEGHTGMKDMTSIDLVQLQDGFVTSTQL